MKTRRAIAAGLIAIVTVAALLPGFAAFDSAIFDAVWVLLPDETPVPYDIAVARVSDRPDPLLTLLSSRAPPSLLPA